ncbi:hypothetical protein phiOC_p391 [Ochrobactrum phage vB_OspM_OC]|nr:hypothetical protein phiOC_p391 [Ochrobactrum phage vB_OspM_OC]
MNLFQRIDKLMKASEHPYVHPSQIDISKIDPETDDEHEQNLIKEYNKYQRNIRTHPFFTQPPSESTQDAFQYAIVGLVVVWLVVSLAYQFLA